MRKFMAPIVAVAAFAALPLAIAQAQQPSSDTAPATQNQSAQPPQIKQVSVVDISELPKATQDQVKAAVAKTKNADLKALHDTINANPPLVAALKKKGATTDEVIAANIDDQGTLTLITKKPG